MPKWTGSDGREWSIRLTVGSLGDVREKSGVDLGAALRSERDLADLIFGDPSALVRMLWVLIEDQAEGTGVGPIEFAHGFDGPALEAATEALLAAVADFFPRSKVGRAIRENLTQTLERLDRAIIAKLASLQSGSSGTAGSSPGSSGSTPDR